MMICKADFEELFPDIFPPARTGREGDTEPPRAAARNPAQPATAGDVAPEIPGAGTQPVPAALAGRIRPGTGQTDMPFPMHAAAIPPARVGAC